MQPTDYNLKSSLNPAEQAAWENQGTQTFTKFDIEKLQKQSLATLKTNYEQMNAKLNNELSRKHPSASALADYRQRITNIEEAILINSGWSNFNYFRSWAVQWILSFST